MISGAIVSAVAENQCQRLIVIMCDDLNHGDVCGCDSESVVRSRNLDGSDVSGSDREGGVPNYDERSPGVS